MGKESRAGNRSRRFAHAGAVFAVAGLLLFSYFVWRAGPEEIWRNISKIGAGFILIIALSGLRFVVRALAWKLSFEPPHRLSFITAFKAYLIGDTAGNIVPLGLVVSEPAKAALVRDRVPLSAGLAAIAVENLFYMLSVALFIFGGATALLLSFPLPKALRWTSEGVIVGAFLFIIFAFVAVRRRWRFLSVPLRLVGRRGPARRLAETKGSKVSELEDRIYGFYERNRSRFLPILLLEGSFHMLGVAEAFLTIYLISDVVPTLFAAFLFESVNRVITMVFKFIPLRAGVDEAGTGQLARVLAFGMAAGVTLAIVRKARMVFWMAVGVAFLVARGLSLRAVAAEVEAAEVEAASPHDAAVEVERSSAKGHGLAEG